MTTLRVLVLLACVVGTQTSALIGQARVEPIKLEAGLLTGLPVTNGVAAYLGIPYAAPPVGRLRWRPAEPARAWKGTLKAEAFGASCMQPLIGSYLPYTEEFMTQGRVAEDCLSVNVWTPAKTRSDRLPVLFWIHGGSFGAGSSAITIYDGAELARKGVIVVSVNYRVGPLGFLAHPELTKESPHRSSGNYGLLDQIAALQWVRRNIAAFGGDPNRVTIFGQSAGAHAVMALMRSPLGHGLFARAIAQSGPIALSDNAWGAIPLADAEAVGIKYSAALGVSSVAELRALPPAALVPAFPPAAGSPAMSPRVVQDGWMVRPVAEAAQVPLMVGFMADEVGRGAGALKPDAQDRARVALDLWARDQLPASKAVYTYYFDRAIPWPAHPEFGAFHSAELPYVFHVLSRLDRPWQPVDRQVADAVSSYWVNFASNGNPNGAGLAQWPAYDPAAHVTMRLGAQMESMPVAAGEKLQALLVELKK